MTACVNAVSVRVKVGDWVCSGCIYLVYVAQYDALNGFVLEDFTHYAPVATTNYQDSPWTRMAS